jgi:hypothetical protein
LPKVPDIVHGHGPSTTSALPSTTFTIVLPTTPTTFALPTTTAPPTTAAAPSTSPTPASSSTPSMQSPQGGGGPVTTAPYRDPFRAVRDLRAERIDMGVDFSGAGPVFPLGPAVIKGTTGAGWGAGGVLYELTAGPASGKWVYVAECLLGVDVHVGQVVTTRTVIGRLSQSCGTGIETGWGVAHGPEIQPMAGSCFVTFPGGSVDPTWYGKNMSRLLVILGVPPGGRDRPTLTCARDPSYPGWTSGFPSQAPQS